MPRSTESNPNVKIIKSLLYAIGIIVIAVCIYDVVSAIQLRHSTGVLNTSSSDPHATLTISQTDHQARFMGVGTARIRLAPGDYQVVGSGSGNQASITVTIYKQHITNAVIHPDQVATLPSVQNINFEGVDALINNGLTVTQLNSLKSAFFQFKPTTKLVNVMTGSIASGPHDRNSANSAFTSRFVVTIDGTQYKASIAYAVSDNVQLMLFNAQTNAQVFSYGGAH